MICITGASGTLGSEVIRQLASANGSFRACYHSVEKANAARVKGIEALTIDYNRPETLRDAFKGCNELFLLGPNTVNQPELETNAVEAATASGIRHIVKQSVFGAAEESFEFARLHRSIEKTIESSGIRWTFLRPNSFMQNVVTFMSPTIKAESAFYSATDGAKLSHVDVRDIAAVAVRALMEPGHEGHAYTLTGPEALSYDELASELSKVLGRPIRHVSIPPADMKAGMLSMGMPEAIVDRLLDLDRFFLDDGASRITNEIMQVTGRNPRRFAQYARDVATLLQPAE